MNNVTRIQMFTDGACKGNPGIGGWGVIIAHESGTMELKGYEEFTTNNKMELTAVIKGLKSIENNLPVKIVTDSQYVKNGINEWIIKWKKNGWKTASKKNVKNKELWQELDQLVQNILRSILDREPIALQVRAAEIFFRSQVVNIAQDEIMLADEEMINFQAKTLQNEKNTNKEQNVEIDILRESSADNYWARSDKFDTSIDVAFTKPSLDGLSRVIEKLIFHFLLINVSVTPVQKIEDEKWSWQVGMDPDSSQILNDLYNGKDISEETLKQILCLFKLEAEEGFVREMQNKPL